MSRPTSHSDEQLLRAGRELIPKVGIAALSIRQVVKHAGVNLGMFHYHFKTKDAFARRVLQEIYEEFFERFSMEDAGHGTTPQHLERALIILARFARDNRELLSALCRDAAQRDQPTIHFMASNVPRHAFILMKMIRQCQRQGSIRKIPIPLAMTFMLGSTVGPLMMYGMLESALAKGMGGLPLRLLKSHFVSDAAISKRVEMALQGLRPTPGRA